MMANSYSKAVYTKLTLPILNHKKHQNFIKKVRHRRTHVTFFTLHKVKLFLVIDDSGKAVRF